MALRVLTLNLWNESGPWPQRAQLLRRWIDRLDPDVIGFQEVLRGESRDLAAELIEGRSFALAFGEAMRFWSDQGLAFGNAVASRWPIIDSEVLSLSHAGDGERRCALGVTVDAPFGPIGVTCTHLHWKLHHGRVRERQVREVCAFARRRRPRGGFPPILLGDFNAEPDSAEIRFITGLQSLEGESVCFYDGWRIAGEPRFPNDPGYTWDNRNPYAASVHEPDRRIDYVFAGYPLPGGVGRFERCRLVCDAPEGEVWPTDHFGVFAELRTP